MPRTKQTPRKRIIDKSVRKTLQKTSSSSPPVKVKKKQRRRYRPGTVALREIRRFQRSSGLLLPKRSFQRLVRSISEQFVPGMRFQSPALLALQEAAEAYLTATFEDASLCMVHAGRQTLRSADLRLAQRLREGKYSYDQMTRIARDKFGHPTPLHDDDDGADPGDPLEGSSSSTVAVAVAVSVPDFGNY